MTNPDKLAGIREKIAAYISDMICGMHCHGGIEILYDDMEDAVEFFDNAAEAEVGEIAHAPSSKSYSRLVFG